MIETVNEKDLSGLKNNSKDSPVWGAYLPTGKRKILRMLVALGLGHGVVKKFLENIWLSEDATTPVDIIYGEGSTRFKLRLHPRDSGTESRILFSSRTRDRDEIQWLRSHLKQGDTFLDIGANVGYYTMWAAALGAARVIAVEPNPNAFERLTFNVLANSFEDRVIKECVAVGTSAGNAVLSIPGSSIGGGKLGVVENPREQFQVQQLGLAALLESHGVDRVDMMKIDIEGMEAAVLLPFFKDAPSELWPKAVVIEHISQEEWEQDILDYMLEIGYRKLAKTRSNTLLKLN